MKRSWIGFYLLLVLLGLGLASSWAMEEIHEPIADKLEDASDAAQDGAWRSAAYLAADARKNWDKWSLLRAALVDHGPAEEVDALFAALEIYSSSREAVAFGALCRELAQKIEAMGDAHGLVFENLL